MTAPRLVIVPVAALLLLTSCASGGPTPSPSESSSSSETPTPTETVEPVSDVLFTVEAQIPDGAGGQFTFVMVAHEPQPWDAPGRESIAQDYIAECSALGGGSVWDDQPLDEASLERNGSHLMVIDITGTPDGETLPGSLGLVVGSPYYYQVISGPGVTNPAGVGCYSGKHIAATGEFRSITNYETGDPAGDPLQWLIGSYGFSATAGSAVTFSSCGIEFTDLATAAGVDTATGWDADLTSATNCTFGYVGE
jgi:hypothetical protein